MEHGEESVAVNHLQGEVQGQRVAAVASSLITFVLGIVGFYGIFPFPQDVAWTFFGTSIFSVALHSWVLAAADLETMKLRMGYGSFSNTVIVTAFCMLCLWRVADVPASCRLALEAGATVFPPLVHARCAGSYNSSYSWTVGVFLHYGVVLNHHWHYSAWSDGWQWLLVLLIVDILIFDSTQIRQQTNSLNAHLEKAYKKMADMSNQNSRKLFLDFCDADVVLNSDGEVCEPPTRLATLLGKSARAIQGMNFTALLCIEDVDKFNSFFTEVHREDCCELDRAEQSAHSLRVDLEGLYGIRIPVVLFHSQYRTSDSETKWMSFIGISEAWQPKKLKSKQSARGGGTPHEVAELPGAISFHQPLEEVSGSSVRPRKPQSRQRCDSPRPCIT